MADATKQSPNGIKAPQIRDSVQVAKERLGKSQSRSLSCYLALYNSCQFLCWSYILSVLLSVPLPRLWDSVGSSLKAVQTVASTMEILHVLLRWVPSSLATNVMQALARHMSLWLVLDLNFNTPHNSSSVIEAIVGPQWNTKEVWLGATVTAWACVEVVRYSMYVSELLGFTPSILKFLRYNAFIVLYPLGFVGEVCGLLLALPHYRSGLCPPSFPQCATNSILLYVAYFYLITSVPGFLKLYTHMFAQRAKQSGKQAKASLNKKD